MHEDGNHAIVLYDGTCNLCSGIVRFIVRRDPGAYFRFAPLQSDKGRELLARHDLPVDGMGTLVLIAHGEAFTQSDAVVNISGALHGPWSLLRFLRLVPGPLRDACYRLVSSNRYRWFGRKPTCERPSDDLQERFL